MNLDFDKSNGLIPVVIQHNLSLQVLMLGYMNKEAFAKTRATGRVTFYSRSKQRLWTKGEQSGNFLLVEEIMSDCDQDTLLIKALPQGPTCHTGSTTCFNEETAKGFLYELDELVSERIDSNDPSSYTNKIYQKGMNKVAQKVGEEAVEVVIEAIANNKDRLVYESADLIYHLLILLKANGLNFNDIEKELKKRSGGGQG